MSSSNQETMSHSHTLNGYPHFDVSNDIQSETLPPISCPVPHGEYEVDHVTVSTRETAKSVQVSAGKKRKVVQNEHHIAPEGRRTRFGSDKQQIQGSIKSTALKSRSAEQFKNVAKAVRQKRLYETFELHDTKVRELFHLTKFVSLVDYDAKVAKQDESEVFKEVSYRPAKLLNL
jgi:hypothetical protein